MVARGLLLLYLARAVARVGLVISRLCCSIDNARPSTANRKQRGCAFLFEVRKRGKVAHVIDGAQWRRSSFVRFANAADWEEEQNSKFVQFKSEIFLVATSDVRAGSELLTWYGRHTAAVIAAN